MIAAAIAKLRRDLMIPVEPQRRGPVPLEAFFEAMSQPRLMHIECDGLTRGGVRNRLLAKEIVIDDLGDDEQPLEGFIFCNDRTAWAFINTQGKVIGRQRFTAAHELGHAVLHLGRMGRYRADEKIFENSAADDPLEQEANRFAAELLMPEEVIAARAEELRSGYRCCPRTVLAYRLAAELLVSREAMKYRLAGLGVGDE